MTIAAGVVVAGTVTVGRVWARIDSMYPGRYTHIDLPEHHSCELDSLLMTKLYLLFAQMRNTMREPLHHFVQLLCVTPSLFALSRVRGLVNAQGLNMRMAMQPKMLTHELSSDVLSTVSPAICQFGSITDTITGGLDAQDLDNEMSV